MTQTDYAHKKCVPCEGIGKAFNAGEVQQRLPQIPNWQATPDAKAIYREYMMQDFSAAVAFIGEIAQIAEEENHHPDIHLTGYRKLRVDLNTHALGGVTDNDFVLAAKINALNPKMSTSKV